MKLNEHPSSSNYSFGWYLDMRKGTCKMNECPYRKRYESLLHSLPSPQQGTMRGQLTANQDECTAKQIGSAP